MIEEVTVKQEPSMEDEPVTVPGNREDYLLSAEKKNQQFAPPLFCVAVKCEFQACVCFHSAYTLWLYTLCLKLQDGFMVEMTVSRLMVLSFIIFSMVLMYFLSISVCHILLRG
jgi:hypothetical protein